jgi:phosphate transport system substrate-binding protein
LVVDNVIEKARLVKLHPLGRALVAAVSTTVAAGLMLTACGSDDNLHGISPAPTAPVNCGGKSDLTAEGSTAQQNAIALFH